MDLMTFGGLFIGLSAVGFILIHGEILKFLLNTEALILIFGGTLGSVMISYPWSALKWVPGAISKVVFTPKRTPPTRLVKELVDLSEKAKRMGAENLELSMTTINHPFLNDSILLLTEGLEFETMRERLERDIATTRARHIQVSSIFRSAGTYSPIFGLLGTLVGVVQVLRNITNPSQMGASMAIAMTASFYGIFAANFIFLPIASKLNYYSEEEMLSRELIAKGILSIQQGEVPWLISRKLDAFLAFNVRKRKPAMVSQR